MAADPEKRPSSEDGRDDEAPDREPRKPMHTPEAYAETAAGLGDGQEPRILQEEDDDEEGPDPLIGKVLSGLYKVENRIGEGGMGTVYLALHVHLKKAFAVKVLSPRIASNKEAVERLRQEAVAASSIDHDNIVNVVNFDATDEGDVFIVMELLKGRPLADLIEEGRIPLEQAMAIGLQLCRALGAAHERGIVHRDLKPENVFVVRKDDQDVAKVLDFGISKIKSAETESVRMTRTGQLVGTPLYMSPEQAKGEQDIDKRADIYALGVMLYEMVTGTPPFEGGNYFQLLWKHGNEDPEPPRQRCPQAEIPEGLEQAILKAMRKDPAERFQSMAEFEAALAHAAPGLELPPRYMSLPPVGRASSPGRAASTPTATPAPGEVGISAGPSRKALALGGVALLAVAALVAGAFALGGGGETADTEAAGEPEQPPTEVAQAPTAEGGEQEGSAGQDDEASPDEEPAGALPEGRSPPPMVTVSFDSRPPGAEVRVEDELLGETPLEAPVATSDEAVTVTFSRRGYRDDVVSVVPEEGAEVRGRLRRIRRPQGGGGDDPPLPIKKEL